MQVTDAHERFTRLLIIHEPQLLRTILIVVPNRADARDILQECAAALWRRFDDYDADRPFVAWAMGFLRIEIRRFLRAGQRRSRLTERAAAAIFTDLDSRADLMETRDRFLTICLESLPETHRSLIDGYYRDELSINDLAERSGRTVEAVYKLLQRVRLALHRCVEDKMSGAEI